MAEVAFCIASCTVLCQVRSLRRRVEELQREADFDAVDTAAKQQDFRGLQNQTLPDSKYWTGMCLKPRIKHVFGICEDPFFNSAHDSEELQEEVAQLKEEAGAEEAERLLDEAQTQLLEEAPILRVQCREVR
ncbi:unnamed protein product [Cladocopium goreaui]|uniref:Uncharacterized protein n=1 Tax=Cladocopium goreaui TaxID=2562237 RepID=A0A9P1CWK7_9DINO|nr:unnamed protein product [Cladocopium goreaui]